MKTIRIPSEKIQDWKTFHQVFAEALGFPDFYGHNMDAWIDCMSDISTSKQKGMTKLEIEPKEKLIIDVPESDSLRKRCPEVFVAFIECTGFANFRNMEVGEDAPLLLFLH